MRPLYSQMLSLFLLLQSSSLVSSASAGSRHAPRSECAPANASKIFDYVVVGGGAAGLVLANRLTENADVTVAVVEAGTWAEKYAGNLTEVPGYAGKLPYVDGITWGFETVVQPVITQISRILPRHVACGYRTTRRLTCEH